MSARRTRHQTKALGIRVNVTYYVTYPYVLRDVSLRIPAYCPHGFLHILTYCIDDLYAPTYSYTYYDTYDHTYSNTHCFTGYYTYYVTFWSAVLTLIY